MYVWFDEGLKYCQCQYIFPQHVKWVSHNKLYSPQICMYLSNTTVRQFVYVFYPTRCILSHKMSKTCYIILNQSTSCRLAMSLCTLYFSIVLQ